MPRTIAALIAASLLAVAGLVMAGPAMASTTDSCVELGPGPIGAQSCFANTSESDVSFAQVQMGRNSAGSYTLVCTDRWRNVFVKQGNIGTGGRRSFFTEGLFGLRDPDCTLAARAHNTKVNKAARVTVTLID
jgi:hypothetical protein